MPRAERHDHPDFDFAAFYGGPPSQRAPWQTDEQYAVDVDDHHHMHINMGVGLALFQILAARLGCLRFCKRGRCRRARRCCGRRSLSWTDGCFLGPLVPPCIPPDVELIEALRNAVTAKMGRIRAGADEPFGWLSDADIAAIGPVPDGWQRPDYQVRPYEFFVRCGPPPVIDSADPARVR